MEVRPWSNLAPSMQEHDRDLMTRLAEGDREALAPLMERHSCRLYRIARSYLRNADEALDVVQETFVKAYRNAHRWRSGSEVGPWLTRIAVNEAIDHYRRNRRRQRKEAPLDEATSDHVDHGMRQTSAPDRQVLGQQLGERIEMALSALSERQRAVFLLRHHEEMSLQEIAATLGLRLGTVKSSLHRAVDRLRKRLGDLL